jgi:hypothetical protein
MVIYQIGTVVACWHHIIQVVHMIISFTWLDAVA